MACVNVFFETARLFVLIVRRAAEKSPRKVIDGKRGCSTIEDGAAHCHACSTTITKSKYNMK